MTINDVHYVAEGDALTPAAETEYARDATFGYRHSNLRAWVSEKHEGQIDAKDVASVPLAELRAGGPHAVAAILSQVQGGQVCVVNAATYRDMEVFVAGLLQAEAVGKRFIYRTAASFVRVRGGLAARPLLTGVDLATDQAQAGGLIVAGSYIQKSSMQIEAALALPGVTALEVSVETLLQPGRRDAEVKRVVDLADQALSSGQDALVYTSRQLVTGHDASSEGTVTFEGATSLEIGQIVSNALVDIVRGLQQKPAWIIAKGGVTSSDVATEGLEIKRAEVAGQAIPGVPVWRTAEGSRWPALVYVVFPGNVGGPEAIADMVQILRGER